MESIQSETPRKRGRPPKNKDQSALLDKSMDEKPVIVKATLANTIQRDSSKTIPEQIAGNSVAFYNWKWPGAEKDFPTEPWLRTVKHCFPYAKDGMILADYPQVGGEFSACERKSRVLKSKGYRYIIVTQNMTLHEAMEILRK